MDRYEKEFAVRWTDVDANGHMGNTAYSAYAVDLRVSFLAEHGFSWDRFQKEAFGPVMLREELEFLKELRLGDPFRVDYQSLGISPDGGRWKLLHQFFRADGKIAARVTVTGGWIDVRARRLVLPPPDLLAALREIPRGEGFEEMPALGRR